jgi:cyanophycinase
MRRTIARMLLVMSLVAGLLPVLAASPAGAAQTKGYGYISWLQGDARDVSVATTPGAMLEGGGEDLDAAWQWFLARAGYGDIVIICATCTDEYNPYLFQLHTIDSAQTLKITKRRASFDPFVVGSVSHAEGIFFAGGDQSDYVRIWKDTPVEAAVNGVIARGGVVGGISAGLAILGQFLFAAEKNTITSTKALADCFNMKITLEQDMVDIPTLASTITDSHFTDRGRLGRLMTFMARTIRDGWSTDTKGIGVDGFTAALLEPDGTATVIGDASVSFLRMQSDDVTTCERAEPLQTRFIELHVLHDGDTFNVTTWTGDPNPPLLVRAQDGALIWGTP